MAGQARIPKRKPRQFFTRNRGLVPIDKVPGFRETGREVKRIVLIDDHELVRIGLRTLIATRGDLEVVGEASGRIEALELIREHQPDLAIVDLVLGRDDGVAFIKECRALYENLHVLVITIQDESVYAERVLRAGAEGFLSKEAAAEKLLEAIDAILAGEIYLSRASTSRILGRVLRDTGETDEPAVRKLTDRELHVFQMIGTGLGTKEIADHLNLSRKTVESYREKIKEKLKFPDARRMKESALEWVRTGRLDPPGPVRSQGGI